MEGTERSVVLANLLQWYVLTNERGNISLSLYLFYFLSFNHIIQITQNRLRRYAETAENC